MPRASVLLTLILLALTYAPAQAQDWAPTGAALTWDNDLFGGTDRHYTNGVALSLFGHVPPHAAPRLLGDDAEWRLTLGQQIYTPEALRDPDPIPGDRPYGGWLYLGLTLTDHDAELERRHVFGVDLGVVGPASGAEELQRFVHGNLLQGVLPRGWRHQVATEPGLVLRYELAQRLERGDLAATGLAHDLGARLGFELGNVRTGAWLGLTGRVGWGLPDPYALTPDPGRDLRLYLTASLDLHVVAHDVFLDGSLLRTGGLRVERNFLVARAVVGFTIVLHDAVSLSYQHVLVTPEFDGQASVDSYGSFALTVTW